MSVGAGLRAPSPHSLRAWIVMRRLYLLVVGIYAITAIFIAALALGILSPRSLVDWTNLTRMFAFSAGFLVTTYFLIYAWFQKRMSGRLSSLGLQDGRVDQGQGGVDLFNSALYAVIVIYGLLYVVISLRFGLR